jgi:hypothetical protein
MNRRSFISRILAAFAALPTLSLFGKETEPRPIKEFVSGDYGLASPAIEKSIHYSDDFPPDEALLVLARIDSFPEGSTVRIHPHTMMTVEECGVAIQIGIINQLKPEFPRCAFLHAGQRSINNRHIVLDQQVPWLEVWGA